MLRMPRSPYYHKLYRAISRDGLTWKRLGGALFDHASVPGALLRDGVLYLYFVDMAEWHGLSVAISRDGGRSFEVRKVTIEGQREGDAVDPHPELVDGTIRLYYLGDFLERLIARDAIELNTIYSAESEDGVAFRHQRRAFRAPRISDPDVFSTAADWRMLVNDGPDIHLLVSSDGGLTFTGSSRAPLARGGVCDTFAFRGLYRTFYCADGIRSAAGADAGRLTPEPGARLEADGGCDLGSPSLVRLPDGSYLMFFAAGRIEPRGDEERTHP